MQNLVSYSSHDIYNEVSHASVVEALARTNLTQQSACIISFERGGSYGMTHRSHPCFMPIPMR